MTKLADVEGIGDGYTAMLQGAGVSSQSELLERAGKPKGRKALAEKSGISEKKLLEWANRADLARVKGIGGEYADLLECAGVDTVPELAQRKAENLHAKMTEINAEKKLVRRMPTVAQVTEWVAQAKTLPRAVHH